MPLERVLTRDIAVKQWNESTAQAGQAGPGDGMAGRPQSSIGSGVLSFEEKKFLLAVERGDVASTRR